MIRTNEHPLSLTEKKGVFLFEDAGVKKSNQSPKIIRALE